MQCCLKVLNLGDLCLIKKKKIFETTQKKKDNALKNLRKSSHIFMMHTQVF